jgi:rod shape-determining protein MreC
LPQARRRLREIATVLGALCLALVLLWQSARDPGKLGAVDRLVLRLVTPLQGGLTAGGQGLVAMGHRYFGLVEVEEKNVALEKENRLLRSNLARLERAALENQRLSRLLEMRDLLDAPTVPARIVAIDTSPYFRVTRVTIDKGTGRVERGMPVIAPEGVVGRVTRVAGGSADVELAVDPRSVIHVLVPGSGGGGLLVGHPGGSGYRCRIQYFTGPTPAKVGDKVVTTGLGGFPRDLPVGTVSRVALPPGSLFQEVDVTPAVDFARLTEVLVLLAPPAEPLPAPSPTSPDSVPTAIPAWPSRGLSFYR